MVFRTRPGGGRRSALGVMVLALLLMGGAAAWTRTPAHPYNPVAGFIGSLHLGDARTSGSLTIVPVRAPRSFKGSIRTLAESLANHSLVIEEIGEGRVNELYVENQGGDPVFIMAGQILVGAKQNRILQHDVLVPPKSGRVAVEAFCVQQGRWHYEGGKTFSRSDNVSNPQVRAAANQQKQQGQVWGAVAKTQATVGGPSATGNLDETYNRPEVQGRIKQVRAAFENLPERIPDMQGAIAIVNGRVLAVDVFGQRAILKNLWGPLLASYLLEAGKASPQPPATAGELGRAFLDRARSARLTRLPTPGSGSLFELGGNGFSGSSLVVDESVLHLELFPHTGAASAPPKGSPNEPPIQRNYQR